MASKNSLRIAQQAEDIFERRLRATLELTHPGSFVAIEPVSGDHFLGATLSEAGAAARLAHPRKPAFIMRIGQKTAVHIGAMK